MIIKLFLLYVLCFCFMQAMDLPMNRTIEPFESSISLGLPGTISPVSCVYNGLMDIAFKKNLSSDEKKKLDSQQLGINAIGFKSDSAVFYSACNNLVEPTIKVFSSASAYHILCKDGDECSTPCAIFSHDGKMLLCASGKHLYFWDTASWKLCRTLSVDTISDVSALALSKTGQKIIVGGHPRKNNLIIITKKPSGTSLVALPGHKKKQITTVGFSPDSTRAVSVSGSVFKIWDIAQSKLMRKEKGKSWSRCKIECFKNNRWFLSGIDHVIGWWFLYDLNSVNTTRIPLQGKVIPKIDAYDRSPCGNYIFLGSVDEPKIMIFNLRTKQHVHTIAENGIGVPALACSPDGTFMVYAVKGLYETCLCMRHTMRNEDHDVLQTLYSFDGDRIEFIQKLVDRAQADNEASLGNEKSEHIVFDNLPNAFKVLLQHYVVPRESLDEHDFTMLNQSMIMPEDECSDDNWTLLG